jgi:hypothetical protein
METQLEIKVKIPRASKKDRVLIHLKRFAYITLFGKMGSQELYHLNALAQRISELRLIDHIPIEKFIPKGRNMAYYIYRGNDVNQKAVEQICQNNIPGYKTKEK